MLKKIVIIGPESTGKSTLAQSLADHFNCFWVPEFAREYLLKNGPGYEYEDLIQIMQGQLELEDYWTSRSLSENKGLLFVDTDLQVIRTWSEFVFNRAENKLLNEIVKRNCDFYLLCNTDLPWVKDELREYPDENIRKRLFRHYKDCLINQHIPWAEIQGQEELRLHQSVSIIKNLME